jgi:hypothetical protein
MSTCYQLLGSLDLPSALALEAIKLNKKHYIKFIDMVPVVVIRAEILLPGAIRKLEDGDRDPGYQQRQSPALEP